MTGDSIAHYKITGKLGEGGMGSVYRATDTKLNRDVAIKVLPDSFADDPDRLARFTREAQVLASLNHPNIAAIYGVEERALVLELVEGPTLAERIEQGAISIDDAIPIARQIAEALEYAHEKGIIHRDLKPANVKITPEGRVRVLDFGLAKVAQASTSEADPASSPTLTMRATVAGAIMGTPGYMPPEQAKGKPVDRRADIWAFGVVLAEMLSGSPLYQAETVSETLAAVLLKEPDLSRLPAATPAAIRTLIRRCLDRDPLRRLRDIGEARVTLEQPHQPETPSAEPPAARRRPWGWVAAGMLAAALAASLYFRPAEERRLIRFTVPLPENTTIRAIPIPAISPDGRRLAFVAALGGEFTIWIRDLDTLAARSLPGTSGASAPFWSPDSRFIGFFAGGSLKKIDAGGGGAVTLCNAGTLRGASWSKSGVILFAPVAGGLLRVPQEGGTPQPATVLPPGSGENSHRYPWFLPDGRHFLYYSRNYDSQKSALYVGDLASGERRRVTAAQSDGVYAPPGYLLYLRDRALVAQPFDAGRAQVTGDVVPLAENVGFMGPDGRAPFSASATGVLAYMAGLGGEHAQLTWFERSGKVLGSVGPPGGMQWPAISPDGKTVAVDRMDDHTSSWDVWLHDLARGATSRLTFDSKISEYPVWSPDGSYIAFHSNRDGAFKIYRKAANGAGPEELLDAADRRADDWSHDGRYLIEESGISSSEFANDLWVLPLDGDRKPFPYLATRARERWGRVSPDGRWLAYSSMEGDRFEVYVTTFLDRDAARGPKPGGKWQVSTNGGDLPVWSRDGKELFFRGGYAGEIMAVAIKPGDRFEPGLPKPLFKAVMAPGGSIRFDVGPDGRFLIPIEPELSGPVPITIMLNWDAGLKR